MNTEQTKGAPAETAPLSIRQISKIEDWLMSGAAGLRTAEQRIAFRQAMVKEFRTLNAEAGSLTTAGYYEALQRQRGVDVAALEPYLAQLRAAEADALARANYLEMLSKIDFVRSAVARFPRP
ncbi:hypothetical protein [Rugamonas sp. DEMB1]|uniref:hypothetical protein n=1 Tax=Rugamonas sp. DEMB1 TaxID=3039386 RepID=UPI002446CF98|nr:hypothetical protein [Rugamonas sp. DEMB1]WGG48943.1 hypothetical protein QC826_20160 [Rugamonas sp. DEMB1]